MFYLVMVKRDTAETMHMSRATRYISTNERATALARGVHLYAERMGIPMGALDASEKREAWDQWCDTWGPKMSGTAQKIHDDLFSIASNYDWASQ